MVMGLETSELGKIQFNTSSSSFSSCDEDADNDGIKNLNCELCDNCPNAPNEDQADADSDGVGDVCDNCPHESNSDQFDMDNDGIGDVCDDDIDGDKTPNEKDDCPKVCGNSFPGLCIISQGAR